MAEIADGAWIITLAPIITKKSSCGATKNLLSILRPLQTRFIKNIILLSVALGLFSFQASAKEITSGTISGQKALAELVTSRFSNLENQTCIRETLDKSKLRASLVAIGMRLTSVTLHPGTSPLTGGPILYAELNYSGEDGTIPGYNYSFFRHQSSA